MASSISLTFWPGPNFGDRLNLWLAEALGIDRFRANTEVIDDDVSVVGFGSLINDYLKPSSRTMLYLFGPGLGHSSVHQPLSEQVRPIFVRGPMTCRMLSMPEEKGITDGAYVFADRMRAIARNVPKTGGTGYIPHHWSLEKGIPVWGSDPLVSSIVDPRWDIEAFIEATARFDRVVTECLHGAIVADILRIPFLPAQSSPIFYSFKWFDWMASLGIKSAIYPLHEPRDLESMDDRFVLSDEAIQRRAEERVSEALDTMVRILKIERL